MNHENKTSAIESFKTDSIPKIVIKNSIPALIAMIMVMVYNLADTFFLGLTHNDLQVTAVSFATPLFMIFMSLGTLFGVGGTSVISRALGEDKTERAKKACSFCMWACVAVGTFFMALLWIFLDDVTVMLGASENSIGLTKDYMRIVIGCGVFSMISNCFSSIVRTEGEAMKAMTGTLIGNLLNMILDPIFILGFKWGVVGAAVATVIGNAVAAGYYILYFLKGKSVLSISPKYFSVKDRILSGVLSVGISASLANLLVSISSIIVNAQLSKFGEGDMLVAGYGVTAKVIMIVTLIGIGVGSGVQPFLGYCYGAKEKKRLTDGIRFSAMFGLALCFVISALCFIFARPIVKVFLTDMTALESGVHFTRILMSTAWLIGAFAICQNTLQAIGAATPALLASIFRQGIIFIPAVFIMKALIGVDGLIWAQPAADVLSLAVVIFMLWRRIKKTDFSKDGSAGRGTYTELKGRKVAVTGASSGIGLEITKLLLENGCSVAACARHIENIDIENENLHLMKCDVSKKENIDSFFEFAEKELGGIDIYISNAGFAYYEKLEEPSWEHAEAIVNTNFISTVYAAEKMKHLHGDNPFSFVVTASAMGLLSLPGYALYSGTKAAVRGFADAYRYELSDGQHFQVVYPIATKTKFFDRAGAKTPVPWPSQEASVVAERVIRGIERNRDHIFPSVMFRITNAVSRVFPFVFKIYTGINNKAFRNWLAEKEN